MTQDQLTDVAKVAITVGRKRKEQLKALKLALKEKDQAKALEIAHELVGLKATVRDAAA